MDGCTDGNATDPYIRQTKKKADKAKHRNGVGATLTKYGRALSGRQPARKHARTQRSHVARTRAGNSTALHGTAPYDTVQHGKEAAVVHFGTFQTYQRRDYRRVRRRCCRWLRQGGRRIRHRFPSFRHYRDCGSRRPRATMAASAASSAVPGACTFHRQRGIRILPAIAEIGARRRRCRRRRRRRRHCRRRWLFLRAGGNTA